MTTLYTIVTLLAQEAPTEPPTAPGGFGMMLWTMVFIIMLWFLIIQKPGEKDRKRREEAMKNEMKKGDRVVTIGGIIGSVEKVNRDKAEVTIRLDKQSTMTVQFNAIRDRQDKNKKAEADDAGQKSAKKAA